MLTAWVLLPDHWHAIIYPPFSRVFRAAKVSSTTAINVRLAEAGELWQERLDTADAVIDALRLLWKSQANVSSPGTVSYPQMTFG